MQIISDLTRLQTHGFYLLLIGFFIRFVIGKRRFKRRGIGGLQHYNSFLIALVVITVEWLLNLLGLMAILLGVILLIVLE